MAETQPMDLQALCYSAEEDRQALADLVCGEGVVDKQGGDLLVASSGSTNHSITVAAGSAYIENNLNTGETEMYRVLNDAMTDPPLQLAAGGGGNPRVDTIIATVRDNQYGGGSDDWFLSVLAGTPNASAALTDAGIAASAAAVPDNSLVLGYVRVPVGDTLATIIQASDILDARSNYLKCGSAPWVSLVAAAATVVATNQFVQTTLATVANRDRGYFSVSGSTITVLQAGVYDVNAMLGFSAITSVGTQRMCWIIRNNTNLPSASPDGTVVAAARIGDDSADAPISVQWTPTRLSIALAANDTLKLAAYQDSTANQNTEHTANFVSHLTVRKVG